MTPKIYAPFYSLMQKFSSSRPGAWLLSRTLHHIDHLVLKVTGGRLTMTSILTGLPVVIVTTIGAKSGKPRTIPLLCIRDQGIPTTFAIIATNWGQRHYPAWYFNLKANSHAICSIHGQIEEYVAHEASGEEYERFWQAAVNTYLGYSLYKQRVGKRHIPILVLTPLQ